MIPSFFKRRHGKTSLFFIKVKHELQLAKLMKKTFNKKVTCAIRHERTYITENILLLQLSYILKIHHLRSYKKPCHNLRYEISTSTSFEIFKSNVSRFSLKLSYNLNLPVQHNNHKLILISFNIPHYDFARSKIQR